ncbi:hypothetical protein [Paraburkholderia kirstenboschensis]|uniref:TetR family transcriptional regulator n=1 Tax=Paraburkholderia kirstenboschensis TaxID=1245436 RepID=A0ABZ0ETQ5_9BURK|nr:hypothetical protein [Paraburkholderia kirstenboschensis]WOD19802.1 hypothetical protein RW095_26700 [Paraburkholderia kirstenboschensis]
MSTAQDKERAQEREQVDMILASFQRDGIATKTGAEKIDYLAAGLLVSYQLLRGIVGDEWVKGWLESALADVESGSPHVMIRKPS